MASPTNVQTVAPLGTGALVPLSTSQKLIFPFFLDYENHSHCSLFHPHGRYGLQGAHHQKKEPARLATTALAAIAFLVVDGTVACLDLCLAATVPSFEQFEPKRISLNGKRCTMCKSTKNTRGIQASSNRRQVRKANRNFTRRNFQ